MTESTDPAAEGTAPADASSDYAPTGGASFPYAGNAADVPDNAPAGDPVVAGTQPDENGETSIAAAGQATTATQPDNAAPADPEVDDEELDPYQQREREKMTGADGTAVAL